MVDRASCGEYGKRAVATIPPEAAATTDETMGKSQRDAMDFSVCLCRENLSVSSYCYTGDLSLHDKNHAEIDQYRHENIDPPKA